MVTSQWNDIITDDGHVLFENFEVDIKKIVKENVCVCPRDSIYYKDFDVFYPMQSSEFTKTLNFGSISRKKKCNEKPNQFSHNIDFYR